MVHLRGLPWSADGDEVAGFLTGARLRGGKAGVHFTLNSVGRPSGEAYVMLESNEDLKAALRHDRSYMGRRYIEVTLSSTAEMERGLGRSGHANPNHAVGQEGLVHVRGLPFGCTAEEIQDFFAGEIVELSLLGFQSSCTSSSVKSGRGMHHWQ